MFCQLPEVFHSLATRPTESAVLGCFAHRQPTTCTPYLPPELSAMNFVIDEVLTGGGNSSLHLDRHGKGLSYLLLSMRVQAPQDCLRNHNKT